jgi:phosphopantetheine--protein transferase-like protein
LKLIGVGIDFIAIARVKEFLKNTSRKQLFRLLSFPEQKIWAKKKMTPLAFAKMFAAKEAFFKAGNQNWLGLDGMASLEVQYWPQERFSVKSCLARATSLEVEGIYFAEADWVGAQVIVLDRRQQTEDQRPKRK